MPQPIDINASEIVAYTRLEPRAVARDYRATVKAQVHDALWMLTQQWRVGEFRGEDAGTLVKARIQTQSTKINRFKSRNGPVEPFDENVPVEAKVERLPLKPDLGLQLELGNIWFKLLATVYSSQLGTLFPIFLGAFPIEPLHANSGPEKHSNEEALKIRTLVTSRSMNGYSFYEYLRNGGNAIDIAPGYTLLNDLQDKFLLWLKNTYYFPSEDQDISWSDDQLEYQCSVSVPLNASPTANQHLLLADKYTRGNMDWYSFDLDADNNAKLEEQGMPIDNGAAVLNPVTFSYIPHTIEFKGMPKGRWWEFEDKNNDLSKMLTQKQDISKMVIMEFGLIYSNDWFLIPHVIPDGTVNTINALVTTDVFGRQFLIERSGSGLDEDWQRWDMYNISKQGDEQVESFGKLLMIPSLKNRMESEAVEKVLLLRDEMANMVWGVEDVVPNELQGGMDGKNANNELQKYLSDMSGPLPEPPDYVPNVALHEFKLSNAVPENWIPFVPKQIPDPNNYQGRNVLLQRAAMLRYINDNYTNDIIRPRTDILSIGIQKIISNTFADGSLHDWTNYGNAQLTAEASQARMRVDIGGIWAGPMITFNVVPGRKYQIRYNIDIGTYTSSLSCSLLNTVGWTLITNTGVNTTTDGVFMEFIATSTQVTLVIESIVNTVATFYLSDFRVEINEPYFINEEETSRSGFVISANFQRTRWYDGRTFTWLGRKVLSGKGEGNSGLTFDLLQDKEPDSNPIDIPFAGMNGWWRADSSNNVIVNGRVTNLKDQSGNGFDLTTWNNIQAPELTTLNNVPAVYFNNAMLVNPIGSAPVSGYDDFTIFHVGNSPMGHGFDDVPGNNLWSFCFAPDGVSLVLVNSGSAQYGINPGVTFDLRIAVATLEQSDPATSPFTAKLTLFNRQGGIIPTPNNPKVITNNYLRDSTTIGLTMGAVRFSTNFIEGYGFETIIYNRKLSDSEMQKVLNYLRAKYPFAL